MALPNHPDVACEFVRTLKECGYRWVLVQEHTVERVEDGGSIRQPHLPHVLVARNSQGQTERITAIVKTQGSDTKLVAQMQPYYEAKGLSRAALGGNSVPQLSAQIADGENGGVMMNEFPSKFQEVMREASGSDTPPVNVSEYLEYLDTLGIRERDFPAIQPILQKRIWDRFQGRTGGEALEQAIAGLRKEDGRFHMEGGSWTNNMSWVRGYGNILGPMEQVSALFAEKTRGVGSFRAPLPQCSILFAYDPDQLLPVLGQRYLDRVCSRAMPQGYRDSSTRFLIAARNWQSQRKAHQEMLL